MPQPVLLEMRGISKSFPGVKALDDVSVEFEKGEVHALMGENGAGKSTLIKTLSGAVIPDAGTIVLDGKDYSEMPPELSHSLGIGVIYQEFNLMPTLTVSENIFMDKLEGKPFWVDFKTMERKTDELFQKMQAHINPKALIKNLSMAEMQLVEIAKAISKEVKILIMDEPTAPLTTNEVDILFNIIKRLKENGVTIIYISHRISEIFELADRVTIMRDGKKISTHPIGEINKDMLIKEMVGRALGDTFPKAEKKIGETVLKVENLSGNGVKNISFELHRGEILGIAGLVGAGRTEIMRVLFGAERSDGGTVMLHNRSIKPKNPRQMIRNGFALIPEDRKLQGVIMELPIFQNISLPNIEKITHFGVLKKGAEKIMVEEQIKALKVNTPSMRQIVKNLSGGNQQKVALAKWLAGSSSIFIFDEPTRGIDVGAKQEIYRIMNGLCEKGMSIIMISSEMEELLGMSDRILVLYEGGQMGMLKKEEFSQEIVLRLASGETC
jgi:ribose transport system ATP-binding protein